MTVEVEEKPASTAREWTNFRLSPQSVSMAKGLAVEAGVTKSDVIRECVRMIFNDPALLRALRRTLKALGESRKQK